MRRQADVRPISGNAANTAIALGLLRGNDTIVANSTDAGGHISHGPVGVFGRRIQSRGQSLKTGGAKLGSTSIIYRSPPITIMLMPRKRLNSSTRSRRNWS